jgi:hypothetical protein
MCVRYFCHSKNAHAQLYHDYKEIMIISFEVPKLGYYMPPAECMCVRYFCHSKNAHAQLYHDYKEIMI